MSSKEYFWTCKHYDDLSKSELHQILKVRSEVFIVEQNCPYQDIDHKDEHAFHLCIFSDDQLIAYSRLLPINISYEDYTSIGRVLSVIEKRKSGAGRFLMKKSIELCKQFWPEYPIKISAQTYLKDFYQSLNFSPIGEEYLEDNIPHICMIYQDVSAPQSS